MAHYLFMWKMMEQYQFDIDPQLSIYVKCIICNNLLNDACQGPCGCLYCKKCIDKYLANSMKFCPGNHKDCKSSKLDIFSNIVKDNSANNKVSKLIVICPGEGCNFQSTLIEMSNHLQNCDKLPFWCPYAEIGCTTNTMLTDELVDHLQTEIVAHNNLLVKWITSASDNSHQPIAGDQETPIGKEMNNVFLTISDVLSKKQVLINEMLKKLKDLKEKINELSKITKPIKALIDRNNKEMMSMKDANEKYISQIKFEISSEIKRVHLEFYQQNQISKKLEMELREIRGKLRKLETLTNSSRFRLKCTLEKLVKIATFRWNIDNLKEIRNDGDDMIYSDYFYSINREYRMRLWVFPNGVGDNLGNDISVQLLVWNNENDVATNNVSTKFPFKADITISIRNSIKPQIYQSISQLSLLDRPNLFLYTTSELFNFNYTHLNLGGVFANQFSTVECAISIYK